MTNNGCATNRPHHSAPQAQAYSSGLREPGAPAPHPGEGTRLHPPPPAPTEPAPEPLVFRQPLKGTRPASSQPDEAPGPLDDGPIIGADTPATVHRQLPPDVVPPVGAAGPRRYVPPPGEPLARKPLPEIYGGHRLVAYWYVPVAVVVAIAVAAGVVWGAGRLFDDDDGGTPIPTAPGDATASPPATAPGGSFRTPTSTAGAASPAAGASPSASASTGPGAFSAGQTLMVKDTGDCLNVRTAAGTANDAIVCIKDGTTVTVTGGPTEEDGFTWWKVETELGEGWAVQDYLVANP